MRAFTVGTFNEECAKEKVKNLKFTSFTQKFDNVQLSQILKILPKYRNFK